jgi:hypothetical protein
VGATERPVARHRESASSTAAIAYVLVPFVLVATLPVVLAGSELVRVVRLRLRGGTVDRPGWRMLGSGFALALVGFLVLSWLGFLAGLGLAFVVWAGRSARAAG